MAAGVRYLNSQLTSAAYSATNTKLATIKDALTTYLGTHGRLPCPDNPANDNLLLGKDDNNRNTTASPCFTYFGVLPYAELGLTRDTAVDGWGNYFGYAITQQWTKNLGAVDNNTTSTSTADSFGVGATGGLTVNTRVTPDAGTTFLANPADHPSTGAAVVVISYGKNGAGAYTIKGASYRNAPPDGEDELTNYTDGTTTFVKRDYADNDSGHGVFDDQVMFLRPEELTAPLTKDGTLSSAVGSLNQTFSTTASDILSFAFRNTVGTPPNTGYLLPSTLSSTPTDPWGNLLHYNLASVALSTTGITTGTPEGTAYTLVSDGPDKTAGNSDDITYTVTVSQLKATFAKTGF